MSIKIDPENQKLLNMAAVEDPFDVDLSCYKNESFGKSDEPEATPLIVTVTAVTVSITKYSLLLQC